MTNQRTIKVPGVVVRKVERLEATNARLKREIELLKLQSQYQQESIAALRDVIQTFQAKANLEGALYKSDLVELIKATKNGQ